MYAAGGVLPGSKHPSTWSTDYTIRVANDLRRQAERGDPLSVQKARRGGVTFGRAGHGEHPRQRYIGPTDERGRPSPAPSSHARGGRPSGHYVREYRSLRAAERFVDKLPTGEPVQIVGFGIGVIGYRNVPTDREQVIWRILYTGPYPKWDRIRTGRTSTGEQAFERLHGVEIRWGAAILP